MLYGSNYPVDTEGRSYDPTLQGRGQRLYRRHGRHRAHSSSRDNSCRRGSLTEIELLGVLKAVRVLSPNRNQHRVLIRRMLLLEVR